MIHGSTRFFTNADFLYERSAPILRSVMSYCLLGKQVFFPIISSTDNSHVSLLAYNVLDFSCSIIRQTSWREEFHIKLDKEF